MANHSIPQDIVDQILTCLPLKSLTRFKCVCKSWGSLLSSCPFTINLFERASSQNIGAKLLISVPCGFKSLDLGKSFDDKAALIVLPLPLYARCFSQVEILGLCHGLICLALGNRFCCDFLLWNPATGESKKLPACNVIPTELGLESYGFGYDPSSDDYKLLLKIDGKIVIFSLAKNSWRLLDEARWPSNGFLISYQRAVYSNGDLHWESHLGNIFTFDLKKEKFRLRPRPDSTVVGHRQKLFEVQGIPYCIKEVDCYFGWVKTYHSKGSWSQRIISPTCVYDPAHFLKQFLCFSKGNVFVTENGEDIIKLDADGGIVENIRICNSPSQCRARNSHFCDAITYVESLISPRRRSHMGRNGVSK